MFTPRVRRWILRVAGALAAAGSLLYLLRWPLFEGVVRREIAALIAAELNGELREARLSGSLLASAAAEELRIDGRPGAPYSILRARRVAARYGLFGLGRLRLDLEGAEIDFVEDPSTPSDGAKTVRDAEQIVRTFRFPGRLAVREGTLVLPDGRRIEIDAATLDGEAWRAQARVPGFGDVEAELARRPDGMTADARASEGPVRRAHVERNGGDLRFSVEIEGRTLEGQGRVVFGPDGTLRSGEADLSGEPGRARVTADFLAGRVEGRADLSLELEDPLRGRVAVAGRLAGPLLGPLRDWKVEGAVARAERLAWRDLAFERVEVEIPDATLDTAVWKAKAWRGPDRIEGSGTWRGGAAEGSLHAVLETTAPYVRDVTASEVSIQGRFRSDGGFHFAGRVSAGAGEAGGVAWSSLEGDVAAGPHGVEVPSIRVKGLPIAPDAVISGSVDIRDRDVAVRAWLKAGDAALELDGTVDPAGRFDVRFVGAATAEGVALQGAGRLTGKGSSLQIDLEPGAAGPLRHGPARIRVDDGTATLEETAVALAEPAATALLSGSMNREDVRVLARDIVLSGARLGRATARATKGEEVELTAAWEGEAGARGELRGRWGPALDLRLEASAPDLGAAWLKPLLPGLSGAATLHLRAEGTPEQPRIDGMLSLAGAAVGGTEPLSVDVPVRSEGRRVVLSKADVETPYGRVSVDVRLPLPGAVEPLEARVRLSSRDFAAFAPFAPEEIRPYLPKGELEAEAVAAGQAWSVTASLRVPSARTPYPFGELSGFEAKARLDVGGLRVDRWTGRLGGGPFEGSLRWDRDGPLRAQLKGRELLVVSTPLSRIRVSADVEFLKEEGRPGLLTGRLEVPLALIHEEPGSPGGGGADGGLAVGGLRLRPAAGGGVQVPGVAGLEAVGIDLQVDATSGEVRVENSIVGARLRAQGRLRGTLAAPSASGTVEAVSGEVKLPAAIFVRIEEARILIPPEPAGVPSAHFVGRVGQGEGSIEIRIHGPLARPDLTLRSDPLRPKEELLARLAFGQAPGQVTESAILGTLAFRIYDQYAAGWPRSEPRDGLLTRLRPTILSPEEPDPRRAPWQLPSSRTSRGMTVRTEYLWTPSFSIVGEADRESNVGGDIKLRFRFR